MIHWLTKFSYRKYIISILMAIFTMLVIGYGYFLQKTVDDVITRSHVEGRITQIRSDIGDAEEKFGLHIGTATRKKAQKLGFREIEKPRFVTRSIDSNAFASANNVQN